MADQDKNKQSLFSRVIWGLLGILGFVYLLNPTAGLFELIPDNIPFVGNLDEATAAYLVLAALKSVFGVDITPHIGRGSRKRENRVGPSSEK